MDTLFLNEQRCRCGKLLLKGIFFDGTLEIKCKKCGEMNKIGNIKLADDSYHYLLIINDKGVIVNASNSACLILGYPYEELIGKHFTEINKSIPNEVGKNFFGSESILAEDNYFQIDTIHTSKDGKEIPVAVLLKLYQPTGKEKNVIVSAEIIDINDKSKSSDNSNLRYLDNACDFYFDLDKNGTIEYISPAVEKFIGLNQNKFIGKNYFDFIKQEKKSENKKIFEYFSANKQPYRIIDNVCKNEEAKNVSCELFFTPNYNDNGIFIGYRVLVWRVKNL